MGVVALAVVALAVVPMELGRRAADLQSVVTDVLEPARDRGTRLALVQARQMARFQGYLLTGDPSVRPDYMSDLQVENEIYGELSELLAEADLDIREELAGLSSASQRWHLLHQQAFVDAAGREAMLEELEEERNRYLELQAATIEMEEALRAAVDDAQRRVAETRQLQTRIALWLVVLAFGATVLLAYGGYQLRDLSQELDARRRDAVRSRREIDALLEATSDGVLGVDLDGRVTSLNQAGTELLGWRESEIRGKDVHEAIHHTRADGAPRTPDESPILAALRRGGSAASEDSDVLWRRDGTSFPARWSLQPMIDGTAVRGGVLTITDMTAIRQKEAELVRAVRARDEVVSIASHDLKNPLGVVTGAAELLLEVPLGEDERRQQIQMIRRSAERMTRLIRDLLDVARIEAGALVVRPRPEDPEALLDEVRSFFSPQAQDRGITLETGASELPETLECDRERVIQALSNLVGNALRFTPEGGTVRVLARTSPGGGVDFEVSDTGPGIPVTQQAHLFDRFWQAARGDREGSGLGLSIVRGVMEAHGGSVEVMSELGEGATFTLRFPRRPPTPPEGSGEGAAETARGRDGAGPTRAAGTPGGDGSAAHRPAADAPLRPGAARAPTRTPAADGADADRVRATEAP